MKKTRTAPSARSLQSENITEVRSLLGTAHITQPATVPTAEGLSATYCSF